MKVESKDLEKSQVEFEVELSIEEFEPYIKKGAEEISKEVKIDGFRAGKVPYDVLKSKIGEMSILEEGARIAINKTLGGVLAGEKREIVGQPDIQITKLAAGNPLGYKAVVTILPEIKLGAFKDLKIKIEKMKAEKKEVDKVIDNLREMRATEALVDREIKEGDKVTLDLEMFLEKVPVEGGQGKGVAVVTGKDYIVPGFDKKIIGAKTGDVKEFSLPYPEDFHMKNLSGKMVEFKVKIIGIYERVMPELDDDFASKFGLKKFEELEKNISESISAEKQAETEKKKEVEMFDKILEKTKIGDIPEMLVHHESEKMMHELEHELSHQNGAKIEDYLASIKKTKEQLILDLMPQAMRRVKVSLVIKQIATEEKIVVSDKEFEEHVEEMKRLYKDNAEMMRNLKRNEYRIYATNILASDKVVKALRGWNFVIAD